MKGDRNVTFGEEGSKLSQKSVTYNREKTVTSNERISKKKNKFTSKNQLQSGELEKTTVTSNLTSKPVVWVNNQYSSPLSSSYRYLCYKPQLSMKKSHIPGYENPVLKLPHYQLFLKVPHYRF